MTFGAFTCDTPPTDPTADGSACQSPASCSCFYNSTRGGILCHVNAKQTGMCIYDPSCLGEPTPYSNMTAGGTGWSSWSQEAACNIAVSNAKTAADAEPDDISRLCSLMYGTLTNVRTEQVGTCSCWSEGGGITCSAIAKTSGDCYMEDDFEQCSSSSSSTSSSESSSTSSDSSSYSTSSSSETSSSSSDSSVSSSESTSSSTISSTASSVPSSESSDSSSYSTSSSQSSSSSSL